MTDLILRIFVRDHKNTEDPAVRDKCGRVAGAVGIVTNFLLFLMKIIVGTVFHSVSVTADAVNNLTDSGSSVVTLIGFKMASKPADEKHPFGHARIEYLSGVIVSFIVIFLGLQLGMSSIEKILRPEENALTPRRPRCARHFHSGKALAVPLYPRQGRPHDQIRVRRSHVQGQPQRGHRHKRSRCSAPR